MDDVDRAEVRVEEMIADSIAKVRRQQARSLPYTGYCHFCEGEVPRGRVFCSKECSDDWEFVKSRERANGC